MLSSISSSYAASTAQSQAVDQFFKKVDTDGDGKITRSELSKSMKADSVSLSSKGSLPGVDQIFNSLDTGNKGYITKQDATAALAKGSQPAGGSQAAEKKGGPQGGGGAHGAGGASSASTSAVTDPADTNGDGKVSAEEELAYLLKQYASGDTSTKSTVSTYA